MQYEYAEPTPRTLQQYCLGGLNGTFKEEGEGEVWKFGPNRSKIRSSSSGVKRERVRTLGAGVKPARAYAHRARARPRAWGSVLEM